MTTAKIVLHDIVNHCSIAPENVELKPGMIINLYGPKKQEDKDNIAKWLEKISDIDLGSNSFNDITKVHSFVLIEDLNKNLVAVAYYDPFVDKDIFDSSEDSGFTYCHLDRDRYPDTLGFKPSPFCGYVICSVYQGFGCKTGNELYKFSLSLH